MRKKAPGYNPGLLVPMSKSTPQPTPAPVQPKVEEKEKEVEGLESMITPFDAEGPGDEMDELVSQLKELDGRK